MKKLKFINRLLFALFALLFTACGSDEIEESTANPNSGNASLTLTTNVAKIDYIKEASNFDLIVDTNVASWVISASGTNWISFDKTSGTSGKTTVKISVLENIEVGARSATVIVNANGVIPIKITINQAGVVIPAGQLYPDYNTNPIAADASGMSSTATQLASKMTLGWNIGNSLEVTGGETTWGNPMVSKALIDLVKANGFNAIRIPCSWNQYMENSVTAKLKTSWLNRVKQVVQYCVDNNMHVIINIHWDGGWLENNVNEEKKAANNAKQKAFWQQIATSMRDFDEHLLFASANEPNVGRDIKDNKEIQMQVLLSYHQTFIDAVRATGGKNSYRTLIVQGPETNIEKTNTLMNTLPTDTATNRMMVEVHYYTPWQFCGMTENQPWGNMFYYWGAKNHSSTDVSRNSSWGEEAALDGYFKSMKTKFVDKGIPVVLGEFGAIRRNTLTGTDLSLNQASRAYYIEYLVKQAKANGLIPFYWDEGSITDKGFGIFDRKTNTVFDTLILKALQDGLK